MTAEHCNLHFQERVQAFDATVRATTVMDSRVADMKQQLAESQQRLATFRASHEAMLKLDEGTICGSHNKPITSGCSLSQFIADGCSVSHVRYRK